MADQQTAGERIAAVALRLDDGEVVHLPPPARHHDLIRLVSEHGGNALVSGERQGFITSVGRYVTR